jgi:hypothetical protein
MTNCICDSCLYILSCDMQPKDNQCELHKDLHDIDDDPFIDEPTTFFKMKCEI